MNRKLLLIAILFYAASFITAQDSEQNQDSIAKTKCDIALVFMGSTISGEDLANSGYEWADKEYLKNIPIIPIAVPTLTAKIHPTARSPFSWALDGSLTPIGIGIGGTVSYTLMHLLKFEAKSDIGSGWNYGDSYINFGVYNPKTREFEGDTAFSTAIYNVTGSVAGTIPLPASNIVQLQYNAIYSGYTGAKKGEPWKALVIANAVNGWHFTTSAMVAHMFHDTKLLKMAALTGGAHGWYNEDDYDECYKPYNPTYVTFTITPMVQLQPNQKQHIMVMGTIARERQFENENFKSKEMLSQVYTSSKWRFKSITCVWSIALN